MSHNMRLCQVDPGGAVSQNANPSGGLRPPMCAVSSRIPVLHTYSPRKGGLDVNIFKRIVVYFGEVFSKKWGVVSW